jgi:hypothetical protein
VPFQCSISARPDSLLVLLSPATTYYVYDGANHLCWSGPASGACLQASPPCKQDSS